MGWGLSFGKPPCPHASRVYYTLSNKTLLSESVISSILSHCNKDFKLWPVLQLSYSSGVSDRQTQDSTPLRHEGGGTPMERPQPSWPLFMCFVSSQVCLWKLGLARKGAVCFIWGSHSVHGLFLCPLSNGFPLCLLAIAILDSFSFSYSNYPNYIRVVENAKVYLFSWPSSIPLYICIYTPSSLSIHPSLET